MPDREKVIKGVPDARRYLEDREWVDKSVGVHIDALNDALELLKEQKKLKEKLLRNIADNQLAAAVGGDDSRQRDIGGIVPIHAHPLYHCRLCFGNA